VDQKTDRVQLKEAVLERRERLAGGGRGEAVDAGRAQSGDAEVNVLFVPEVVIFESDVFGLTVKE
jgi:hypothetical protein